MLSKANAEKLVFGGIYTANPADLAAYEHINTDSPWDQRYRYWVPVRILNEKTKEHKFYMVNCYQIDSSCYVPEKATRFENLVKRYTEGFFVDGSSVLNKTWNYYYKSGTLLTDYNLNCFKFVADLHDYRYVSERDSENYLESNVLRHVQLFREHNYPNGIVLVRKDAKESAARQIEAMINDAMRYAEAPRVSIADLEKLRNMISEAEKSDQTFNVAKTMAAVTYLEELAELQTRFEPVRRWYLEICCSEE